MINQKISAQDILKFHTGDEISMMEFDPQEIFGVVHLALERTFRNLPKNMKLTDHNKEIVKKLLRTEFIYQAMLFNEPDIGEFQ